jgi:hypothetical protein
VWGCDREERAVRPNRTVSGALIGASRERVEGLSLLVPMRNAVQLMYSEQPGNEQTFLPDPEDLSRWHERACWSAAREARSAKNNPRG